MESIVKLEADRPTALFSILGVRQSSALNGKHLLITGLSVNLVLTTVKLS